MVTVCDEMARDSVRCRTENFHGDAKPWPYIYLWPWKNCLTYTPAMALKLTKSTVRKILHKARQTIRWSLHPPQVRGSLPPMLPGGVRMGDEEEEAVVAAVREVMRAKRLFRYFGVSRNPFQKSKVLEFERAFAARMGVAHALAVNSGTSALVCGLVGLGVGPEDEVIVPAYTWVSTASAVLAVGAVPVIAEVDESLTLDVADVSRKISPCTRAIIPVHMRGAPAAMDELMALAHEKGLYILEDAAQAAGASFHGKAVGSIGHAGAYSFHMTKIIAAGEGGMVTTNDDGIYRRALMYHDSAVCPHEGVPIEEWLPGVNLRLSELHAAVAQVQLLRLDSMLADMRASKARLRQVAGDELQRKGVAFRTSHDAAGDASIALDLFPARSEQNATGRFGAHRREHSREQTVSGPQISAARSHRPARLYFLVANSSAAAMV